jgi:CRP/FNR family transcriptional regulator, cyclic AMP receptor protein
LPGHTSRSAFLLIEGRVRLYKTLEGHELTLDVIEEGSMFGEASLVDRPQWAYCQALEPSKVARLGVDTFRRLVMRKPEVGLKAMELFVERLHDYESKLADIGLKEVLGRLGSSLCIPKHAHKR